MTTLVKWIVILLLLIFSQFVNGQQIEGVWNGNLIVSGVELPVVFKISKSESGYVATLKSPKQSDQEFSCDKVVYENNTFSAEIKALRATYQGQVKGREIKGVLTQMGKKLELNLQPGNVALSKRPQDPVEPYPYHSVDVVFANRKADNIKLSGTLTLPKNIEKPPVVILISGSGPQDRNEEIAGINHRPFLVLSDFLTRKGIAVLRYDERGIGKSEGSFEGATSVDFASDVEAGIDYLKTRNDIDSKKVGLIGHSEGGIIAPMVASKNTDVAYIILLAGTGVDGGRVLLTQMRKGAELANIPQNIIEINNNLTNCIITAIYGEEEKEKVIEKSKKNLKSYYDTLADSIKVMMPLDKLEPGLLTMAKDPWFRYFIKTDPVQFLSKVKIPVLALNGSKDVQVLTELNLKNIEKALNKAGNKDYTIREIKGVNHLFQTAETGATSEYAEIEETFNPEVMMMVTEWIKKRF